ncbi:hypothetical protein RRSWK_06915 [Rhodopirellula sp. SWK7]|nr:hypothetical protein RRSWK_06915 [Rhodopirellula sp. SWK7]
MACECCERIQATREFPTGSELPSPPANGFGDGQFAVGERLAGLRNFD